MGRDLRTHNFLTSGKRHLGCSSKDVHRLLGAGGGSCDVDETIGSEVCHGRNTLVPGRIPKGARPSSVDAGKRTAWTGHGSVSRPIAGTRP